MLNASDQIQYCNKIYDICFNQNKILKKIKYHNADYYLNPLLLKVNKEMSRQIEMELLALYKEDIIFAYLLQNSDKLEKMTINVKKDFIFNNLYTIWTMH
jgi:hypothetical protein